MEPDPWSEVSMMIAIKVIVTVNLTIHILPSNRLGDV